MPAVKSPYRMNVADVPPFKVAPPSQEKPSEIDVRMVYGTCLTLNLAAEAEGTGAAVLIRALQPLEGLALMQRNCPRVRPANLARGPGRLCAALGIGRELSGVDLGSSDELWLERGGPRAHVQVSTRIGLSRDQHRRLRFLERGSPFVSVRP